MILATIYRLPIKVAPYAVERVGRVVHAEHVDNMETTIKHAWITLNRQCNLRCYWCYARNKDYCKADDMPKEMVEELVDFLSDLQLEYVALIGGEPTCYPYLEDIVHKIASHGMKAFLLTNGLAFADREYLERLISRGLVGINLSMKGWSAESYEQNTGVRAYDTMRQAMENIAQSSLESIVSFVISFKNVDFYLDAVASACRQGIKQIYLSFEHDFSVLDGKDAPYDLSNICYMVKRFTESYDRLQEITQGHFVLHQSLPLCIWEHVFIEKLRERGQIQTSCQLLERSGLVFDTDGSLVPCNSMYQIPIGKFGVDFASKADFETFWNSSKIRELYNRFAILPGVMCNNCGDQVRCGGGCIANWFQHDLEEWIAAFK